MFYLYLVASFMAGLFCGASAVIAISRWPDKTDYQKLYRG